MTPEQMLEIPIGGQARYLGGEYDGYIEVGTLLSRVRAYSDDEYSVGFTWGDQSDYEYFEPHEIELLVEEGPSAVAACGTSIARPVLEERKVGKIAIELFDHGFPNAIMAVGEVMTWAAEHKGYKPHDWKNLPNAEVAFDAAGSRHRIKRHIQAGKGLTPEFRTDDESDLLHLAHEAFNVLAQLELVITGKIQ
jgi:hypothetical protein